MKRVAILVAASPTSAFYSQVAVLKIALDKLPWSHWQADLHVYVGGSPEPGALERWQPYLSGIQITRTSDVEFALIGDWAQSDDVFTLAPPDADIYLALDADTLPIADLEPILDSVLDTQAMAGVIAHYPPFPQTANPSFSSLRDAWQQLAHGLIDRPLSFEHSYTLLPFAASPEQTTAPFYLNFGVVFFAKEVFRQVATRYVAIRRQLVNRLTYPDYSGQVALTLVAASEQLRACALPMRYNFPNDPIAERLHPAELDRVAVFHYLRTEAFDRHQIFLTAENYSAFLALQLHGVNNRFQDAVRAIIGERYPFD